VRNNSKLSSGKIIEELPQKVPSGHIVSLTNPELVIFVVVFKVRSFYHLVASFEPNLSQSVAGIGVLPRYDELKRYNVAQLVDAKDLDIDQGEQSRLKKQSLVSGQQVQVKVE
jgi:hypothetical protein